LTQTKGKNMLIRIDGDLEESVTSKDLILHVIGIIGTAGGTGYTIEFAGSAVESLSMEARMSISNMAIEAGARSGIIAPDETTYAYLKGRPMCPSGEDWDRAVAYWNSLRSDEGANYDETVIVDAKDIAPTVTWGTSPQDVAPVTGKVPTIDPSLSPNRQVSDTLSKILIFVGLLSIYSWSLIHSITTLFVSHYCYYCFYRPVFNVLSTTLVWKRVKFWKVSQSPRCLLDPAPTDVSKISATSLPLPWAARSLRLLTPLSFLDRVSSRSKPKKKDLTKY
jgi:hypothetical protein